MNGFGIHNEESNLSCNYSIMSNLIVLKQIYKFPSTVKIPIIHFFIINSTVFETLMKHSEKQHSD